jgi:hypothetical protein
MAVDERFTGGSREAGDGETAGTRSEIITGPVRDWATDFSHLEPEWSADPYSIQDDLRQRCPIARTERFGGAWLPTRYEDVAAIAHDTERFSSRSIILSNFRPPRELAPVEDNRYQAQKMKMHGLFSDVHDEVGDVIVADVSADGVKALLTPDQDRLNALIQRRHPYAPADLATEIP